MRRQRLNINIFVTSLLDFLFEQKKVAKEYNGISRVFIGINVNKEKTKEISLFQIHHCPYSYDDW